MQSGHKAVPTNKGASQPGSVDPAPRGRTPVAAWDLGRIFSLLKTNVEEIESDHPSFFGTLKIEINFREGEIETVIVDRRQTFKN